MTKPVYHKRHFLNTPNGMAAIEAEVGTADGGYVEASFAITDCNRLVSIDFNAHSPESITKRLAKLERLITTLTEFQTAYKKQCAIARTYKPKKRKKSYL